jgi:VanZ family protein
LLAIWDPIHLGSRSGVGEGVRLPFRIDKIAHVILYLILGLSLEWGRVKTKSRLSLAFLILLGLGYGVFTESLQFFAPNREMNFSDGLANVLGVLIGFWAGNRFLLNASSAQPDQKA